MTDEQGKPPPKRRVIHDPVRRERIERAVDLAKRDLLPGMDGDASLYGTAVDVGATTVECYECKREVLEFWVWRGNCRDAQCTFEVTRCRQCDPDASVTRGVLDAHQRAEHPGLYTECSECHASVINPRFGECPRLCGFEVYRCRTCDKDGAAIQALVALHKCPKAPQSEKDDPRTWKMP